MRKENNNVNIYEKIKKMSPVKMAEFINLILCHDNLINDVYCDVCRKTNGRCLAGDEDCIYLDSNINAICYFLNQPYDKLQSMLDDYENRNKQRYETEF